MIGTDGISCAARRRPLNSGPGIQVRRRVSISRKMTPKRDVRFLMGPAHRNRKPTGGRAYSYIAVRDAPAPLMQTQGPVRPHLRSGPVMCRYSFVAVGCGELFYWAGNSVGPAGGIHRLHLVVVSRLGREVVQVHAEHRRWMIGV